MQMENPETSGLDFQNGPLKGFHDIKAAIMEQQHGKCLMCKNEIAHFHHIVPRSKGGSDTLQNQVGLCTKCHAKVHTNQSFKDRLEKKKAGLLKKYGALSALIRLSHSYASSLWKNMGQNMYIFVQGKKRHLSGRVLDTRRQKIINCMM